MVTFTITADGTSSAKYYDEGQNKGSVRTTARAKSADWESGSVSIIATKPGSNAAMPIAGLQDMTEDVANIPIDIPRGAALTAVCASKSGTTPIYVEID
jgi:hypothetical protein